MSVKNWTAIINDPNAAAIDKIEASLKVVVELTGSTTHDVSGASQSAEEIDLLVGRLVRHGYAVARTGNLIRIAKQ